jgi:RHS repeat-associated protein
MRILFRAALCACLLFTFFVRSQADATAAEPGQNTVSFNLRTLPFEETAAEESSPAPHRGVSATVTTQAVAEKTAAEEPTHNTDVSPSVTTDGGEGYDAWSGSITRTVVDLDVPGATADHGLKWTRTFSSGLGFWSTAYGWDVTWRPFYGSPHISHPDGREGPIRPGSKEQFVDVADNHSSGNAYLYLEDGSKVTFYRTTQQPNNCQDACNTWEDYYQPISVTDRHGNVTRLECSEDSNDGTPSYRLDRIVDPSGRYLQLTYDSYYRFLLLSVTAHLANDVVTDSVSYSWVTTTNSNGAVFYLLSRVDYSDGTSSHDTSAYYTYADTTYHNPNNNAEIWHQLELITAQETRAIGAMQSIQYEYQANAAFQGQIKAEHYLAPSPIFTNALAPPSPSPLIVSSFSCNSNTDPNLTNAIQVETRGDSPSRQIKFNKYAGDMPLLTWKQDYKGQKEFYYYDVRNYLNKVTDRNGNSTTYTNTTIVGEPLTITHPDGTHIDYTYTDNTKPYWISTVRDERGNTTTYTRDTNNRITHIDYPPDSNGVRPAEDFVYNSLGEVTRHTRKNGKYEHFAYDASGLLTDKWNPTSHASPQTNDPKIHYDYYTIGPWRDRVSTVTYPANASGKVLIEIYEYDRLLDYSDSNFPDGQSTGDQCTGRGLVTKISYPNDTHSGENPPYPNGTYKSFAYDKYGRKVWEKNELQQPTTYQYDAYGRLTKVTNPMSQSTAYSYESTNGTNTSPLLHTTNSPRFITDPALVKTTNDYDENFRKISSAVANNNPTWFHYDAVGNQDYVTDPRGTSTPGNYTTYSDYDNRNRRWRIRAPIGETTTFTLDAASNVANILRPDGKNEVKVYDNLNRLLSDTVAEDPLKRITYFVYNPSGTIASADVTSLLANSAHQIYTFLYDESDRRTQMQYPTGSADTQTWDFDDAGNLHTRKTVANETQSFTYDSRNRNAGMSWSDNADSAAFQYDAASRMTDANNPNANIHRTYNSAGQLTDERQSPVGANSYDVVYTYGGAGRLLEASLGSAYDQTYAYDTMGRIQYMGDQTRGNTIKYTYDANSNITRRDTLLNNTYILYGTPDALNRMPSRTIKFGSSTISTEVYGYDNLNRLTDVARTEDGSTKSDKFGYDVISQMTSAQYGLVGGINPSRNVSYVLDNSGNRKTVTDNGTTTSYTVGQTAANKALNQYAQVGASTVTNGNEHEISNYQSVAYSYINDGRLSQASMGATVYGLKYDALGRTVKRTWTPGSTYYYYQGEKPIMEQGAINATNIYGIGIDEIVIRFEPSDVKYFYQDHEGSVTHVRKLDGTIGERYRYDAFGLPTIFTVTGGITTTYTESQIGNRFMFAGREWAPKNLGFYEYRARAYHPGLGRFMSEDPKGFDAGDYNLFRYCHNDPEDLTDPMGTGPWLVTGSYVPATPPTAPGDLAAALKGVVKALQTLGYGANEIGQINGRIAQLESVMSKAWGTPIANPRAKSSAEVKFGGETPVDESQTRVQIQKKVGGDGAYTTPNIGDVTESSRNGKPLYTQIITATRHLPNDVNANEYKRLAGIEARRVGKMQEIVGEANAAAQQLAFRGTNAGEIRQSTQRIFEVQWGLLYRNRADVISDTH